MVSGQKISKISKMWNRLFAEPWKGVTREKPPTMTTQGEVARLRRLANVYTEIATTKHEKKVARYWRRLAQLCNEDAKRLEEQSSNEK